MEDLGSLQDEFLAEVMKFMEQQSDINLSVLENIKRQQKEISLIKEKLSREKQPE